LSYEGDWLALFDILLSAQHSNDEITNFNGRLKDYCERAVGVRYGSVDEAMNAFAQTIGGVATWGELGTFDVPTVPPAEILYDFAELDELPSSIGFTRSTLAWDYNLKQFASGKATLTRDVGWLLEKNTTNLMQVFNAAPTDLTGVTATAGVLALAVDSDKLAESGIDLSVHNGSVWRLDNTGVGMESTLQFTTSTVSSTSQHSATALVRGSGESRIGVTGVLGAANTLTDNYQTISHTLTPAAGTNSFEITVSAGGVLLVTLPQLETGDLLTSPIVTAGAAQARDRVVTEEPYSRTGPMTLAVSFVPKVLTSGLRFVVDLSDGTGSNRVRVAYDSTQTLAGCIVAGTAVNVVLAAPTLDQVNTVVLYHDGANALRAKLNGGTEGSATSAIADTTDIQYGHDWTGSFILNGFVSAIAIWKQEVNIV
jgi:hypothetical protein